jgi:hypothetical protein
MTVCKVSCMFLTVDTFLGVVRDKEATDELRDKPWPLTGPQSLVVQELARRQRAALCPKRLQRPFTLQHTEREARCHEAADRTRSCL